MKQNLCEINDLKELISIKYPDEISDIGAIDFDKICKDASTENNALGQIQNLPSGGTNLDVTPIMEFLAHAATVGAFLLGVYQFRRPNKKEELARKIREQNEKYNEDLIHEIYDQLAEIIKRMPNIDK